MSRESMRPALPGKAAAREGVADGARAGADASAGYADDAPRGSRKGRADAVGDAGSAPQRRDDARVLPAEYRISGGGAARNHAPRGASGSIRDSSLRSE